MCLNWSHYISDLNELIIWSICLYDNTDNKYLWYKYSKYSKYSMIMILIFSWNKLRISNTRVNYKTSHNQYFLIYHYYTTHTTKLLGGILVSLRPSVRPASRVRSVAPTVLVGSISYLYILSSNFRRCVVCKVSCKIWIFGNFFKFVTLTLSCFDLGSDVNH